MYKENLRKLSTPSASTYLVEDYNTAIRRSQVAITKGRVKKKARDGFNEGSPVVSPEQMQVHPVGNGNLPTHSDIKVQRDGRILCTSKSEML